MSDARVIARVKKLLALARSDEKHEAARAQERATSLIAEHKISVTELVEADAVTIIADDRRDHEREELALVITKFTKCEIAGIYRIGFHGPRAIVEYAASTYRALAAVAEADADAMVRKSSKAAKRIWHLSYWAGLASALNTRLGDQKYTDLANGKTFKTDEDVKVDVCTPEELIRAREIVHARSKAAADDAIEAAKDLADEIGDENMAQAVIQRLMTRAHETGKRAGLLVTLPEPPPTTPSKKTKPVIRGWLPPRTIDGTKLRFEGLEVD